MDVPLILQHLGEVIENDWTRTVTKRYFPIDTYTHEIPAKSKYRFDPAQLYTDHRTKCFCFYPPPPYKKNTTIDYNIYVYNFWHYHFRKSHPNYFLFCRRSDSNTSMDHRRSHSLSRLKTIMANRKKESRGKLTTNWRINDIYLCIILYHYGCLSLQRDYDLFILTTPIG